MNMGSGGTFNTMTSDFPDQKKCYRTGFVVVVVVAVVVVVGRTEIIWTPLITNL